MELNSLEDVLKHEIEDLYSAETQIIEALPLMAHQAASEKLRQGFEKHLGETEQQLARLQEIADELGVSLPGKTCKGMEGLIREGSELLNMTPGPAVDAALISAAQRIEHYEIAGYGSAVTFANLLQKRKIANTLQETLAEEVQTDKTLTEIAETEVNKEAKAN